MTKVDFIRLKRNIFDDTREMLMNYELDRDERFTQHIAEEIAKKYVEKKGIEVE